MTLALTTGAWSDFGIAGHVVTLKECDLPKLAQQYANENRVRVERLGLGDSVLRAPDCEGFLPWLVKEGYAAAAEVQTVHLGSYDFEKEFGVVWEVEDPTRQPAMLPGLLRPK